MEQQQRIPPQAVEVEENVLGSMMNEVESIDLTVMMLKAEDLYKPAHQKIYNAIVGLHDKGSPVDCLTIKESLKDFGDLEKAGGDPVFDRLLRSAVSSANVEYYCQIIKEKAIKRNLILECSNVIKNCYKPDSDTYDVVDDAQARVFGVVDANRGHMRKLSDSIDRLVKDVQRIQESGEPVGLRTGLDIDNFLQGFQDGKLYFIGARPSMGKTALVMTIMRRIAHDGKSSGILSMETSDKSLATRLITQVSELEVQRIVSGKMTDSELERFSNACADLYDHGIYIDDEPALSAQKMRSKCRLMKKKGVQIIFIDFLQLMTAEGRSKHEEIGTITKTMKQVAKELDMPIVALSQLSRKVEDRQDKRPQMADLRESGSIEEDADCIMFIYRPEYYGISTTPGGQSTAGLADIIIAKHKDGKTGLQSQRFIPEYMRFENIEHRYTDSVNPTKQPFPN